jgi:hypothetical protein
MAISDKEMAKDILWQEYPFAYDITVYGELPAGVQFALVKFFGDADIFVQVRTEDGVIVKTHPATQEELEEVKRIFLVEGD